MYVTATATRSGDWWAVDVPEVPGVFTQAKRLDQIEAMVRDAVSMVRDVDPALVEVGLHVTLPSEIDFEVHQLDMINGELENLLEKARGLRQSAVLAMREQLRLSVRDVAVVLELSPQRVSQIEADARAHSAA